jgi:hypothetical protein
LFDFLQDNFADHFNTFDYTGSFGSHHQSTFHQSPPSPPVFGQHPRAAVQQQQQQQQHQDQQQHVSDHLAQSPSTNGSINGSSSSMRLDGASGTKIEADDLGRGSEDEDSLTPAQSRRKAQNRAA